MTPQPDNLFRNKLEDFQMQAPAGAWSKIETGLNKSERKGWLWLRVAAGVMLLLTAGLALYRVYIPSAQQQVAAYQENTPVTISADQFDEPANTEQEITPPSVNPVTQAATAHHAKTTTVLKPAQGRVEEQVLTAIAHQDIQPASSEEVAQYITQQPVPAEAFTEASGLYLVYTADEVNQKYFRPAVTEDATSSEKKSSRMQMLMAVANNITSGDAGIGDLRHWKDEVLALNFLDRKTSRTEKN